MGAHHKFGLPVREAKRSLAMPLLQVDIEKARKEKPKSVNDKENFLCCVIAQAATRAWGAERVVIQRTTAYVAFPGEGHVKRYEIDDKSRAILEAWDRGEPVVEGVELRLKAPSKRRTLKALREAQAEYQARTQRNPRTRKTRRKQRASDPLEPTVRHGNFVRWN